VLFVLAHDRGRVFDFTSLQSDPGRAAVERLGGHPGSLTTMYVIAEYRTSRALGLAKARAVLFVVRALGWPWTLAAIAGVLPVSWLNRMYDVVARHRYRLPGRRNRCQLPGPECRHRFLDSRDRGRNRPATVEGTKAP
jgi:predicted DCC family thiol-disulfide oxidoreductase YuxK